MCMVIQGHFTRTYFLHRYEECKEKLVPFLKKVGFNPKKDIHFMPCSGLTGANLKESSEMCPWYTYVKLITLSYIHHGTGSKQFRPDLILEHSSQGTLLSEGRLSLQSSVDRCAVGSCNKSCSVDCYSKKHNLEF